MPRHFPTNLTLKEVKISKTENYTGREEWWSKKLKFWYNCPICSPNSNCGHINFNFKYCPDCGIKLKWVK